MVSTTKAQVVGYNFLNDSYDVSFMGEQYIVRSEFLACFVEWDTDNPETAIGKSFSLKSPPPQPREIKFALGSYSEESESFDLEECSDGAGFVVGSIDLDVLFMLTGNEGLQTNPESYANSVITVTVH